METKVSIEAAAIRRHPAEEALSFATEILGEPSAWSSSIVGYRLASEFQADWKLEVGCWLLLARDLGFLPALRAKIRRATTRIGSAPVGGPNDKAHLVLNQELAPAMVIYYFVSLGWTFDGWEPDVQNGDVDVRLRSPDTRIVDLQVKAPDQPGSVAAHRRVDGEFDERVLTAVDNALDQLDGTPGPCRLVVVSPQRTWSMDGNVLLHHLLSDDRLAKRPAVSGVADLHLLRGLDQTLYRFTVILNPWCNASASLPVSAFPHARVYRTIEGVSEWVPEAPGG
ncbi:MAG TPA: hypothetical protein VFH73_25150 [Polyangia bacterium]|jgi:hypothetical protein|nr:hypothetical protein [Polyangia bacterium]